MKKTILLSLMLFVSVICNSQTWCISNFDMTANYPNNDQAVIQWLQSDCNGYVNYKNIAGFDTSGRCWMTGLDYHVISNNVTTKRRVLTVDSAGYYGPTDVFAIHNYTAGTAITISTANVISNALPDRTVSITAGTGASVTGIYPNFTISTTYTVNPPVASPTHSVASTGYRPSITKGTHVSITAQITSTLSLTGGQTGELILQYSSDNITYINYASSYGSNIGTLVVGLNTSAGNGGQLSIDLPVGYYWRWTTSGTGVFSIKNIFETPIN